MDQLLYVPAEGASRVEVVSLNVLRYLIAAFFVLVAFENLAGDATRASEFQRWGYPYWFRIVTAAIQITGALLLISQRAAFFGALMLSCVMLGAIITHVLHDPPTALLSPIVFLVLVGTLATGYRPPILR